MAWLEMRDTEGRAGHRNRIMVLREFARYLNAIEDTAYLIPISMTAKSPRYIPHIFTTPEIAAFFYGADHFIPHKDAPARHLVVPVFYRLFYCCGLRPAEARLLRKENVDLVRGVLYIEESKGHKGRAVVVADDLLHVMRKYTKKVTDASSPPHARRMREAPGLSVRLDRPAGGEGFPQVPQPGK